MCMCLQTCLTTWERILRREVVDCLIIKFNLRKRQQLNLPTSNQEKKIYKTIKINYCWKKTPSASFHFTICAHPHVHLFGFDVVMSQIQAMAEDIQPLLAEVRDSGLLKEVENLTTSLTQVSEDVRWTVQI